VAGASRGVRTPFNRIMNIKLRIRQLFNSIKKWWKRQRRFHSFEGVTFCESDMDPTSALHARQLVLVGSPEKPKWLRFACPCRCGEVIALNLMNNYQPHWSVTINVDKTLNLSPSIDATSCRSHFWIRKNRIEWV
jgi:hypothetical protein